MKWNEHTPNDNRSREGETYISNFELFSVIYTRYTSLSLGDEMVIVYFIGQETHFWLKKQTHFVMHWVESCKVDIKSSIIYLIY